MSVICRRKKKARNVLALKLKRQGQVALEDNFRFVVDKSDLKSASDKKFATVAFENKICEQNITSCCEGRAIFREAAFTWSQPQNHDTRDLKICYHNNFFILFPRSSAESKYQFNATLSVIYAEFTCTKLNDTMYSLTTQSDNHIADEHHNIGLFHVQSNRGSRTITLIGQYQGTTFEVFYEWTESFDLLPDVICRELVVDGDGLALLRSLNMQRLGKPG